jgi:hypothetical protein
MGCSVCSLNARKALPSAHKPLRSYIFILKRCAEKRMKSIFLFDYKSISNNALFKIDLDQVEACIQLRSKVQ